LKPENVLYKTESHHSPIVIADFGIAKHLEYDLPTPAPTPSTTSSPSNSTSIGKGEEIDKEKVEGTDEEGDAEGPREGGVDSFAGSFGYAAPEVLLGLRHGLKVDCWSIGYVSFFPRFFRSPSPALTLGSRVNRMEGKGRENRMILELD
jgi:calcium/calmodulin-dependent protein kinase I